MLKKYNINRKAEFIGLDIILHDLICYNEELQKPALDNKSLVNKLRYTRNVFMCLYNVKDLLSTVHVTSDKAFAIKKKALQRELEFIVHVRNKGVGHLDKELLKRAAQWEPHVFHEECKANSEFATLLCYKALIETCINSYQTARQGNKPFSSEIDLMHPPNAKEFYEFLARIVDDSISLLEDARRLVNNQIEYHSAETLLEMAALAGQTNFDLNEPAEVIVDGTLVQVEFRSMLQELRRQGVAEPVLNQLETRLIEWERHSSLKGKEG